MADRRASTSYRLGATLLMTALVAAPASAQLAARVGDPGEPDFHAGSAIASGDGSVLIGGVPAARAGDPTSCPQVCVLPTPPFALPHGGGVILTGSSTVRIGGAPAARSGSTILESSIASFPICDPSHAVLTGSPNVLIGP